MLIKAIRLDKSKEGTSKDTTEQAPKHDTTKTSQTGKQKPITRLEQNNNPNQEIEITKRK